jgi:hypothetical protein
VNNRFLLAGAAAAIGVLGAGAVSATVVFSDNFNSDTAMLNWPGDSVFLSIPQPGNVPGKPSVDLVGVGDGYGNLADGPGNSVDLDGTTGNGNNPAGELQSVDSLPLGNYTVQFDLAGNLRGAYAQTTVVSIGGESYDITPPNTQPYTLYTFHFTDVSGPLVILDNGPSDQQGNLLDNVVVSTGVPEPATWALMLAGFLGVGGVIRGGRRTSLAAV